MTRMTVFWPGNFYLENYAEQTDEGFKLHASCIDAKTRHSILEVDVSSISSRLSEHFMSLSVVHFPDVHVYDARSRYWVGQILKGISGGESLYLTTKEEQPWGITIHFRKKDDVEEPHYVEFANGKRWTFCGLKDYQLQVEWPLLIKDVKEGGGKPRASVKCVYSDSLHLSIISENAILSDMLLWRVEPKN